MIWLPIKSAKMEYLLKLNSERKLGWRDPRRPIWIRKVLRKGCGEKRLLKDLRRGHLFLVTEEVK